MADTVFEAVSDYVAKAVGPLVDRIKALEERAPEKGDPGRDGTSVTLDDIRPLVDEVVAALPAAKDGQDGKSVTVDEVLPALLDEARKALAEIPAPKDGRDGEDGKSFTLDEVKALVREAVESEQAKWALDFERRAQDTLQRAIDRVPAPRDGKDGQDGRDGKDGLGFDDLQMDYDGQRTFTFSYVRGDVDKSFSFVMPLLLDRGVFKDGSEYEQGDVVTWGGSMWIAQTDTKAKPGEDTADWRLSVKKGRDGKAGDPGKPGERGLPGKDGLNGRDLR